MDSSPGILDQTWRRAPASTVIIAINAAVFVLWWLARGSPGLEEFMVKNFVVSPIHLREGYFWTLVTSAFSQIELWHIFLNMFVLWSFGMVLESFWGSRTFVVFYLVAGVAGSLAHCATSVWLLDDPESMALGASGAVAGLLMAYALHFPKNKILLFGIVPIPALVGVLAFVALDLYGLSAQAKGGGLSIGHAAHLGGALAGALMWFFYLRKRYIPRTFPSLTPEESAELERILLKAKAQGPDALTPEEHEFFETVQARLR